MPKHESLSNWSEVNETVSKAGLNKQKNVIENLRKINYRNVLEQQIEEHTRQTKREQLYKQKQRQKLMKQVQNQRKEEIGKKIDRVKAQQFYQLQNLDLIKLNKSIGGGERSGRGELQGPPNQLFKLEDRQKMRKLETRKNFQIQNLLNSKQVEIKNSSKNKEKQQKLHQKQMYDSYIEGQYTKQQSDRQLWKNKYLYDKSIREMGENKNYGYAYRSFLKKQMDERKNKIRNQSQKMDQRLRSLNQTVENVTPSPAYLGLTESFDRRKQMSAVDRLLHFEPYAVYQKEYSHKQSLSPQPAKPAKIECSLPQIRQPKQAKTERYSDRKLQSQSQRKQKQYTSYDFITGVHKTFFM